MNIEQIYQDYSLDFKTEGHKHCRPGWVNVECPWCSSTGEHSGYHLGFNIDSEYYRCWRCGWHPIVPTLSKLLVLPYKDVENLVKQFGVHILKITREIERSKELIYPSDISTLKMIHKKYLEKRGFDPDKLEKMWGIAGTGPTSILKNKGKIINYKHRIFIPFIWDHNPVSFDTRDISGKSDVKYIACPAELEVIPHKDILYGKQEKWNQTGICVEGPTDTWRFGQNSFATSGISYKPRQVRNMARIFKRIWVCYDSEESQALQQAKNLCADLKFRNVDAKLATLPKGILDPGSMKQDDADYFVKDLLKLIY